MAFEYCQGEATDRVLGVVLRRARFIEELFLEIEALPWGQSWRFMVKTDKALRPWESKNHGSGLHAFEVAYRLPLNALRPIVDELATIKAKEHIHLTQDQWLEVVRQGVFALIAAGGTYLRSVPDLSVSFES